MSTATEAHEDALAETETAVVAPPPRSRTVWRWIGMPLFLLGIIAALTIAITTKDIDSIEARSLGLQHILQATGEHLLLTVFSTIIVLAIAVPLGIALTRQWTRRFRGALITVANIGQAVPTIGLIALMAVAFNYIGFGASVIALVACAVLPVLRNTMVGIQGVDETVLEAGRGMGMSRATVLRKLELPLAVPVILAGVRTALVINVGTATLAAYINAGGLGKIIIAGLSTNRILVTVTGAALTAVLALAVDYLAGVAEQLLRPKGL